MCSPQCNRVRSNLYGVKHTTKEWATSCMHMIVVYSHPYAFIVNDNCVALFPFSCALCTSFTYESWHIIFNYHYKLHPRTLVYTRTVAKCDLFTSMCNDRNDVMSLWTTDHPVFVCVCTCVDCLCVCLCLFSIVMTEIALAKPSV